MTERMANFIPHLSLSVLAIGSSVYGTHAFVPPLARPLPETRATSVLSPTRCPIDNRMARRPIEEILLELDAIGISFPPTATRSELERILSEKSTTTSSDAKQFRVDENNVADKYYDYDDDDDDENESRPETEKTQQLVELNNVNRLRRQRQRPTTRIDFYNEVDNGGMNRRESRRRRRQQQIGPLAPADLLFRVVDKTSRTVAWAIPEQVLEMGSKATRLAGRTTQQIFYDLVDVDPPRKRKVVRRKQRLDDTAEQGVPSAEQVPSPESQDGQRDETKFNDHATRDSDSVVHEKRSIGVESTTKDSGSIRVPIQDILSELIRRNIRFSPMSTREELEQLLEHARRSEEQPVTPSSAASMDATISQDQGYPSSTTGTSEFVTMDERQENVWKKASRVTVKKIKTVPKTLSKTIRTKAKNTYRKARNSAARLFEDPSDLSDNDNTPIIVDAIVEDISKEQLPEDDDYDVIDVEPFYGAARYKPPRRRTVSSNLDKDQNEFQVKTKPRRRRSTYQDVGRSHNGRTTIDRPTKDEPTPKARLPRLSPAKKTQSQELESKRDQGRRSTVDRTIYSPYRNGNDIYVDGLDRLGDFVANSVDSFLWGSEREKVTASPNESPSQSSKRRRSGNWKDKMEEQFDYLLGIHEDGDYYNRWINDEDDKRQSTDSTEGVPNTGRRKARSGKKRQPYEKPIWEEEGSLLSMLFGTDDGRGQRKDMFYQSPSTFGSGSVVKIIQTLLRSATLVTSGVCRWASVRGSLPQPIVVIGVLSSVLSSRPGSRIRNLIFAVLALRAVAELLHGYTNDDTDFWDPLDGDQDPITGNRFPGLDENG